MSAGFWFVIGAVAALLTLTAASWVLWWTWSRLRHTRGGWWLWRRLQTLPRPTRRPR